MLCAGLCKMCKVLLIYLLWGVEFMPETSKNQYFPHIISLFLCLNL